jgi:hypothetical protein
MKTVIIFCIFITTAAGGLSAQGISIGSGTTLSLGGATLSLPNNWSNAGTFTAGTGTVIFNGTSGDQTITNASGETFQNLTINKASGEVVLNSKITVNGTLTITSGDINLDGDTLLLGTSATLAETPGNTVKGTSGVIMATRTLGASPGNVAGLGADISSSPVLGVTTVVRGHKPDTVGTSNSICRYYKIAPANNSGLNATVTFKYDQSELNNLTESTLKVFNSINNGNDWTSITGSLDTLNNTVSVSNIGSFNMWSFFSSSNPPVAVEELGKTAELPKVYALAQNYPNPFNPVTSISFDLPKQSSVVLKIFDVIGREVATLVNANLAAGKYTKTWNASSFTSGVYFYRLDTQQITGSERETFISTKKLLLVK